MNNDNETNKSVVTSYRLKEDTKENIKRQLSELGLTQEEYFNKVVSMMELENVKKNNIFAVNTTELQELTQRIYNIFVNVCEQGNSFLNNKDTEIEELKNKYKDMLLDKDNSITSLKQELQSVYSNLEVLQKENNDNKNELLNVKNEYNKQLEQLESSLQDKTLIVEEYKQKNDMLLSNLQEYKQYKEQYQSLEKDMEQLKANNITLITDKTTLENTVARLQDKVNNDADKIGFYKDNITDLKKDIEGYRADLKSLEDKRDKQIENIKADHEKVLQEQEKALENKYNKHIEEIKADNIMVLDERIKATISEYSNKLDVEIAKKDLEIEKLNNIIEQLKTVKPKQHKPKANKTEGMS